MAEAMRSWVGEFENWSLEVDEFIDADERVLVIGRQTGRGKLSAIETEQQFSHLVTVRGGKIVHWKAYLNRQEALEAVGLSE